MVEADSLTSLIKVAKGSEEASLVLKNCNIVDVFTHSIIEKTNLAIKNDRIIGWGTYKGEREIDMCGEYICPGFMDAHVHMESTQVSPPELAKIIIPEGTLTLIADPHEIGNVYGLEGIKYMLDATEKLPMNVYIMLPSCVPATFNETSGAVLDSKDLETLITHPRVLGLGEMMNFPGVINTDSRVISKIEMCYKYKKIVDGHCPFLTGQDLTAYTIAGIQTDHECTTIEEMKEKIALGMYILIREGTSAQDLDALIGGVTPHNARRCLFCTDDKHSGDIMGNGHISNNIRKAVIKHKMDPITAIQLATLNVAECYGLEKMGGIAPGYVANLVVLDSLESFKVRQVYYKGVKVAEEGKMLVELDPPTYKLPATSMKTKLLTLEDFRIPLSSNKMTIMQTVPHSLITKKIMLDTNNRVEFQSEYFPGEDLLKLICVERHKGTGNIGHAILQGFGFKGGALGSTVAHDSHNILVVGDTDKSILAAIKQLKKIGGGMVLVEDGRVLYSLPLEIGGLMSNSPMEHVAKTMDLMLAKAYKMGFSHDYDPYLTLGFLALPVIPEIKITDKGLFDVVKFDFIPI